MNLEAWCDNVRIREWVWLQTIQADIASVLDALEVLDTQWPPGVVLLHSLAEE